MLGAFDPGSTQNPIFGPDGLQVILQHFWKGILIILIFSDFPSSFLSMTSQISENLIPKIVENHKKSHKKSSKHHFLKVLYIIVPEVSSDTWRVFGMAKTIWKHVFMVSKELN